MSIINDALKKAEQESKKRKEGETAQVFVSQEPPPIKADRYNKKSFTETRSAGKNNFFIYFVILVLVVMTAVFGKRFLFSATMEGKSNFSKTLETPPLQGYNLSVSSPISADKIPVLSLNGIVYDEEKPYAIVNNKVLLKGDEIGGARLLEINRESVKFSFKDKEFEIKAK